MSADDVASAFAGHYYRLKDTNPDGLANLFQPGSMMTFEGQQFQGAQSIVDKLKSIGPVKYTPQSHDVQPGCSPNAILMQVSGTVSIGGTENPLAFTESIQLNSLSPGQYYAHNIIFRLQYALQH